MSVFNVGPDIYHTDGSRVVWSTTRRPSLLLPKNKITLNNFDVSWPDLAKANAYGYTSGTSGGFDTQAAASFITAVPQSWDSGLQLVATIPSLCNYIQVDVSFNRISTPSLWLGNTIPMLLRPNNLQTLDGASAAAERIGPMVRIFRFEVHGNGVYLRRKQSVLNAGERFSWNPGNATTYPGSGGQRPGWTWGDTGGNLGHACSLRDQKSNPRDINRNQPNMCAINDNTNYASLWRGTVTITPGYIAP